MNLAKHIFPYIVLCLASVPAMAQTTVLNLGRALAAAEVQPSVKSAEVTLTAAQDQLKRAQSDPLATKPTLLQAQQAATLAKLRVDAALSSAKSQIVSSYTEYLEAEQQLKVATLGSTVAGKGLAIAKIREKNGSGTALDTANASTELAKAESGISFAQSGLALAKANLSSLVGTFSHLSPLSDSQIPTMPEPLWDQLSAVNTTLVQADQGAQMAELQASLLGPSYASRSQIQSANAQAQQAKSAAQNAARGLTIKIQNQYDQLENAYRNMHIQYGAFKNAEKQFTYTQARYQSGLISEMALLQAQLTFAQSKLSTLQAQNGYLKAYYALLAARDGQ